MSDSFFAFRALMGVFAGFSSAAIALVASQVPEGRLGYAPGWLSTGQLVGPLIGGAFADLTGSYRIPFYCTLATIVLSIGLVWIGAGERFAAPPKARGRGSILNSVIAVASTPALLVLLLCAADGAIHGITASAMTLGNSLGPLTGGAVAPAFGLRWVFLVTPAVPLANLLWVYYRVPEYAAQQG